MTNVVLIGPKDNPEVKKLSDRFGRDCIVIDTVAYPKDMKIGVGSDVIIEGQPINPDCYITHFLIEHPFLMAEYYGIDKQLSVDTLFEYLEKYALFTSLLQRESDHGKLLINSPDSYYLHHIKPYQLQKLRSYDIPTPQSVSTTDPAVAANRLDGKKIVRKPLSGHRTAELYDRKTIETSQTSAAYTYQEYIPGKDIRVYVLGGTVIGAYSIETRDMPEMTIDYRGFEDDITEVNLDSEHRSLCRRVAELLDVQFCAIDCKLQPAETRSGAMIVLECNPNPGFVAVEEAVGRDVITDALTEFINKKS